MKKLVLLFIFLIQFFANVLAQEKAIIVVSVSGSVSYLSDVININQVTPGVVLTLDGKVTLANDAKAMIYYNAEFISLKSGVNILKDVCNVQEGRRNFNIDGKIGERLQDAIDLANLAGNRDANWTNINNFKKSGFGEKGAKDGFGDKGAKDGFGDKGAKDGFGDKGAKDGFGDKGAKDGFGDKGAKDGFGDKGAKDGFGDKGAKDGFGDKGAKDGFGDKGAKDGFGEKGAKDGFGDKGAKDGFGDKGVKDGFGDKGAKDGFGEKGAKDGFGDKGVKDGFGDKGVKDGFGDKGAKDGFGDKGAKDGFGDKGAKDGFGDKGVKDGFGDKGAKDGFGDKGVKDGFGDKGVKDGFGDKGAKDGFGDKGAKDGFGDKGAKDGFGDKGAKDGFGDKGAKDGFGDKGAKDGWGGVGKHIHLILPAGKLELKSTEFSWSRPANTTSYQLVIKNSTGKNIHTLQVNDTFVDVDLKKIKLKYDEEYQWVVSSVQTPTISSSTNSIVIEKMEPSNSPETKLSKSKIYNQADVTTQLLMKAIILENDEWYYEAALIYKTLKNKEPKNQLVKMMHAAFWYRGDIYEMADAAVMP